MAKSVGLLQPTPPFTTSSPIRCMLALTPMAKADQNVTSMNTVLSKNGCANYLSISGPFSFNSTILATSIGPPSRPTKLASIPTHGLNPISPEAR